MKPNIFQAGKSLPLDLVHHRLNYRPLNLAWAKLEILLGVGAAAFGVLLEPGWLPFVSLWQMALSKWLLIVLGVFLALGGHRSHIYRSMNESTALLLEEMSKLPAAVQSANTDIQN
jgi:hypothetical protein